MAAPNIVNVATINGKTTYSTPANNTANVLLANASGSGKVFKINMITATNVDGSAAYSATVAINTVADGSGTSYPIASTISVPANAAVVITEKTSSFYLEENKSILVTASTASKIAFVVSYEDIS